MNPQDLNTTISTILAFLGGATVIVTGISSLTKMLAPFKKLQADVAEHTDRLEKGNRKFKELEDKIDKHDTAYKEICKTLILLLEVLDDDHKGTDATEKIEKRKEDLQHFLIDY